MLLCVYLLYCLLQVNSGCEVDRGQKPDISKSVGDSVVLPCSCTNPKDKSDPVQWGYTKTFRVGKYEPEVMVFPEDDRQSQRYRGRVQREIQNPPGYLSLIISDLTEEDGGTYVCGVNGKFASAVTLHVKGCSVLEIWDRSVTKSPGESVLLPCPCPSDSNITPRTVTWSFSKEGQSEVKTPVSNDTGSYRSRVWTFDQEKSRNFSLLVSDLTKEDSGRYLCTVYEDNPPAVELKVTGCALLENKQTVIISKYPRDSVLLSCSCTELQDKPVTVQWITPHHGDLLSTELPQRYNGRVQTFNQNSPGNLSVLISDLTEEDGGRYSCWINQNQYRHFSLSVRGCTLSEPQEKTIIKYPGDSVLLPCSCSDTKTKPQSVKWQRVDSGGTEVSSGTDGYNGRLHMFNEGLPANLSLLISNLMEQDEGTYRCTINNNQSISITLNVKGNGSSLLKNWEPIIILCVFILILLSLLGGVAYSFWKYGIGRKIRSEEETGQRQKDMDWETYTTVIYQGLCKPTQDQVPLIMTHSY
ncbi:polymeric immunoglobulin receptor-like isoform X2 [Hoplias malabaricus]|uniref:polymeric immunoglobulin receptor-like isoform X2 n=1 Tax=Hoplias malabaricus TaxID=27720 RepID=UPI0034637095